MGIIHGVNFKIKDVNITLDKKYENLYKEGKIKRGELNDMASKYNNVIKALKIIWEVEKIKLIQGIIFEKILHQYWFFFQYISVNVVVF